jgi:hypothetical protein
VKRSEVGASIQRLQESKRFSLGTALRVALSVAILAWFALRVD